MNFTPNSTSLIDALADVGLVVNVLLSLAVLVLYLKNFHWWWIGDKPIRLPNVAGRSFVVFLSTHTAVLALNASSRFVGLDYPYRDVIRFIVYWLGVVGGGAIAAGLIYYLVVEKRKQKLAEDLLKLKKGESK